MKEGLYEQARRNHVYEHTRDNQNFAGACQSNRNTAPFSGAKLTQRPDHVRKTGISMLRLPRFAAGRATTPHLITRLRNSTSHLQSRYH